MATRSDFTADEWESMQRGIVGSGWWVAISEPGFFDSFKEGDALEQHLRDAHAHSDNESLGRTTHLAVALPSLLLSLESECARYDVAGGRAARFGVGVRPLGDDDLAAEKVAVGVAGP